MSVDFAALALAVVSGVPDVRACLVVSSRDGLALGAHPASEEEKALAVWSRVAALGEVERGFVVLRDEAWAFCRRGPYAALATGHPSTRAGVVLDALEQMLLAAEEARVRKEVLRPAQEREGVEAIRGPRTSLHAGLRDDGVEKTPAEMAPAASLAAGSSLEGTQVSAWVERLKADALRAASDAAAALQAAADAAATDGPDSPGDAQPSEPEPSTPAEPVRQSGWVDTASLSREFAGLFALGHENDNEER